MNDVDINCNTCINENKMTAKKDDTNEERNPVGRPPKFKTPGEMQVSIDRYFSSCDPHMEEVTEWVEARTKQGKLKKDANGLSYLVEVTHKVMTKQQPYLVSGLARSLGMSRQALIDYGNKDEFLDTVTEARRRCEEFAESQTYVNPTAAAFILTNNWGWKNRQEVDHTTNGKDLTDNPYAKLDAEQLRALAKAANAADSK